MSMIDVLIGFVVGVIASILGNYLLYLSAWKPFKDFRKTGVLRIFKNQESATKSMLKDIETSSVLRVLAMKGESFSNHLKEELSTHLYNASIEQRYLISSCDNAYLQTRNKELGVDMSDAIKQSIKNFQKAQVKNKNIEMKLHKEVVRFRIILLDNSLYLSFQETGMPGRKSPVLKIDKDSAMYQNFSTLFTDLWNKSDSM